MKANRSAWPPLLMILWGYHSDEESGRVDEVLLLMDIMKNYEIATIQRLANNGPSEDARHAASRVLTIMGHG